MPNAPAVACRCGALNCEKHNAKANAKQHDQWRGSAASRGYDRNWSERIRPMVLRRYPLCCDPFGIGCVRQSTIGDHAIPKTAGGQNTVEHNLQGVCDSCHNRKIRLEQTVTFTALCGCVHTHARIAASSVIEFGCAAHVGVTGFPLREWTLRMGPQ
jgi:5-methylcytosine-specific restriction enzyme A